VGREAVAVIASPFRAYAAGPAGVPADRMDGKHNADDPREVAGVGYSSHGKRSEE
jgi:hypothetical protein